MANTQRDKRTDKQLGKREDVIAVPNEGEVIHYEPQFFTKQSEPITIAVIGCGGTGYNLLKELAYINDALIILKHPGLKVVAIDDDIVSEANIGRGYTAYEIGMPKSKAIISQINRIYGFNWLGLEGRVEAKPTVDGVIFGILRKTNVIITCTDSKQSRLDIASTTYRRLPKEWNGADSNYYWMDIGNADNTGQIIMGSFLDSNMRFVHEMFDLPNMPEVENKSSCSLMEALKSQDLFINRVMALHASQYLWSLIRDGKTTHNGYFINLKKGKVIPIVLK